MDKFIDQAAFRELAKTGRADGAGVYRAGDASPVPIEGTRRVRFCFSDGSVDRMGDTIDPAGWDLTAFKRNPVALFGHDSGAPPIGRACNVQVEGARLMGDIEFADANTYAFADTIYKLAKGGYINTVSVGFMPTKYELSKDPDRPWGIDFLEQELLEISVVPVPANANALVEGRGFSSARRHAIDPQAPDTRTDEARLAHARRLAMPVRDLETTDGRIAHAADLKALHGAVPGKSIAATYAQVRALHCRW